MRLYICHVANSYLRSALESESVEATLSLEETGSDNDILMDSDLLLMGMASLRGLLDRGLEVNHTCDDSASFIILRFIVLTIRGKR